MIRPAEKRLFLAAAVLAAVIAASALLTYRSTGKLFDATEHVARTHRVRLALAELLSSVKDAETGQRGFLITGLPRYLEPYQSALSAIGRETDEVNRLTGDNARQQAHLAALRKAIAERLDLLHQGLVLRRDESLDAARDFVVTDQGRRKMDEIRDIVGAMMEEETTLLRQRASLARRDRRAAVATEAATSLFGLLSIGAFVLLLYRYLRARERSADVLYNERELFRTTLASIGDAVISTDTAARVTFLNGVAQAITGWTTEAARGEPLERVFRIVDEKTREPVPNPAQRALREGVIVGLANHTTLIARDGTELPIDDSAAPIRDAAGQLRGVVLVFRDITDRRRAEASLREADRRKDEFLATLAHELRNPLAPMQNALKILRLSRDDPSRTESMHAMMERQLRQMVRLTDDLLDVSRITRNKLELRREILDVRLLVESGVEVCAALVKEGGHTVTIFGPSEPLYIDGDRTRLEQALCNLLNNAAKYTEPGGHITVTIERDGDQVVLLVRDTGIGIPADMLEHIFEMFAQVDRSLERAQGGLGIGLPLVRRIVSMHGGTVEARSEGRRRGSVFIVRLPLVPPPPAADVPTPPAAKPSGPARRVLIADDNHDAAESLGILLRSMGHDVRTVHDGLQAIDEASAFRPDVALLDIGMPKLNGYDAAVHIRGQPWGKALLLVAMTGWGHDEDRRRSKEAGFDHHLIKPVDFDVLERILDGATKA